MTTEGLEDEIGPDIFVLGSTGLVNITGGPNDWDMWLCLRGTHHQVSFYTKQIMRFSAFADRGSTFFGARIIAMERNRNDLGGYKWIIRGEAFKVGYSYPFRMSYDLRNRKGEAVFGT